MAEVADATALAHEAAIPVRLTLAASDLVSDHLPPPVMAMVSRAGYLAFAAEEARPLFQHLLPPGDDTPWLEYRGRPLPWNVPAGVLHDLLCAESAQPWSLTVHYRACPAEVVLPWTAELWRSAFMNSLKEAAVVLAGGAGRVLQMTSATQAQLWEGVQGGDMRAVAAVAAQLGLPPADGAARLPVRIVVLSPDGSLQTTSLPVAVAAGGEAPSLQAFLDDMLVCSPSARGNGEVMHDSPPPQWRAKVAGISAPTELSVAWLWTALHSADQFLYIAVTL